MNCLFIETVGVINEDACDVAQMWLIACKMFKMYECNVLKGATCNYKNFRYILETTQSWFDSLQRKRSFFNY